MSARPLRRILVTGGAGFLGSHLCERLLAEGFEVLCFDNLLTGRMDSVEPVLGNARFSFEHHVDDLITGILKLPRSDHGGPMNVGNPSEMTLFEMAKAIVAIADSPSELVFRCLPPDDPKVRRPDISLARQVLDWEPRAPIEEGLRRTCAWFREALEKDRSAP